MSVSINLQSVITWVQTILRQQPLNVTNLEPGLTFANIVLQRILGPPMRWRFNRGNVSWAISQTGGTDYVVSIPDLLWPEDYWLANVGGTVLQPVEGRVHLPKSASIDRPGEICPVYDDNEGNITLRCNTIPDANYTAFMDYQRKAKLLTSYGSTFGPVPDEFSYIFQKLYLAVGGQLVRDPRAGAWSQEGVAALLGAQNGLTFQEIAIFLAQWDRMMNSLQNNQGMEKIGIAGDSKVIAIFGYFWTAMIWVGPAALGGTIIWWKQRRYLTEEQPLAFLIFGPMTLVIALLFPARCFNRRTQAEGKKEESDARSI